jgi:hypothetical protein
MLAEDQERGGLNVAGGGMAQDATVEVLFERCIEAGVEARRACIVCIEGAG